jgi:hypothetical protein
LNATDTPRIGSGGPISEESEYKREREGVLEKEMKEEKRCE